MLNQQSNSEQFIYAMSVPIFGVPELVHKTLSDIISYTFSNSSNIYTLNLNDQYSMMVSLNSFFSYDTSNHFATSFYRLYTNNYSKIIHGPVIIFLKEDPSLIPYLLLEELNSLIKNYK
jgi:hypothetical protein